LNIESASLVFSLPPNIAAAKPKSFYFSAFSIINNLILASIFSMAPEQGLRKVLFGFKIISKTA